MPVALFFFPPRHAQSSSASETSGRGESPALDATFTRSGESLDRPLLNARAGSLALPDTATSIRASGRGLCEQPDCVK